MSNDAINLVSDLIKVESYTPTHPEMHNFQACSQALDIVETFIRENTGPAKVERFIFGEGKEQVENLLAEWIYYPHLATRHFCFGGHVDIVPVKASAWTVNPFGAEILDGYIYGRGALDMKGSVAAFLAGMKSLHETHQPRRVTLVLTTDEEWDAINGTLPVLSLMKARGIYPHAFLFGEPTSHRRFGDRIARARPGSLNCDIILEGVPGHPGYPEEMENPAPVVEDILRAVRQMVFPDDDLTMQWKTYLTVTRILADGGSTTITPDNASVRVNFRYTDAYNPQQLHTMLQQAVEPFGAKVVSNFADASMPYRSGTSTELLDILQAKLQEHLGERAEVFEGGGTSDARCVQQAYPAYDVEILEFGLFTGGDYPPGHPNDRRRGGMHQHDERAKVSDIESLARIYADTIAAFCRPRVEILYSEYLAGETLAS